MTHKQFKIEDRLIGEDAPCYIIAEISCNHEGDVEEAKRIIDAAAQGGADAAKLQTYKPQTMTRDFNTRPTGTMWEDIDLFKLYEKAHTPWEWHQELTQYANQKGLQMFSTPFDETAVDYLMEQNVPAMKIASFEAIDIKLIEKVGQTGLPVIISNGMTDFLELEEAIRTLRSCGVQDIAVTHCNSGYPASFDEVNLRTMCAIEEMFDVVVGLSDHTIYADDKNKEKPMPHIAPLEAVKMGAKIIEVHLLLDRDKARLLNEKNEGGFDWSFSRDPAEFKQMVDMIRQWENTGAVEYASEEEKKEALRTHGTVQFDPTEKELNSRILRPSLWVVDDIKQGEVFTFSAGRENIGNFDSIRPTGGLHIRFTDFIEGLKAKTDIAKGQPLTWDMVEMNSQSHQDNQQDAERKYGS